MALTLTKYAAIDIGSNAVRLLIANIIEQPEKPPLFRKNSLVRVPVRLGADVFTEGKITEFNLGRLSDTMLAFRLLMRTHGVKMYKACATSAMREANNSKDVIDTVFERSGLSIDIIDGEEEASIIATTDIADFIDTTRNYLYVDVGGGSTEFSVLHLGQKTVSRSFKIGTVRLLDETVSDTIWREAESWVRSVLRNYDRVSVIGTGGNINKIFKISGKSIGKPLTYFYLTSLYKKFQEYTYEERITELDLNTDRADVIIPATRIYLSAMNWAGAEHIYVPKIGLSDGIIKSLYFGIVAGKSLPEAVQR